METELTPTSSQPKPTSASFYTPPMLAAIVLARLAVLIATLLLLPKFMAADEPMKKFVEALRDRDYFDVAIDYLENVKPASLSPDSQERLPLEKATTYRQAAAASRDLREADTLLAAAQKAIEAYRPGNVTGASESNTARFRGDLLFSRARVNMARTSSERISETQRNELLNQTRSYLTSSRAEYQAATESLASVLKNFQIDPDDSSTTNELARMRAQYTYLKTRGPALNERLADTWNESSQEHKQLLEQTAVDAKTVWTKYRKYGPTLAVDACLTAARCYQKLGQLDPSQQMINQIFALQRAGISPTVRREAFSIAIGNWQATQPFPWETVVAETEPVVKMLTPQQSVHPQWQAIQLVLARALHQKGIALSDQRGSTAKRDARDASEAAIKLAQAIASVPGAARPQAVNLLKEWNASSDEPHSATASAVEAKSFAEAERLGTAIVREIDSMLRQISAANQQVRQAGSPAEKQRAQAAKNELTKQQAARSDVALKLFQQAILLADESVTRAQINGVRYLQCYCHFAKQQYIESSVIAEFLLERYPNATGTRKASAILLRNHVAMLDQATGDKAFEKAQLTRACQAILNRYPDTTEASAAAARLAQLSLVDSDFDQAKTWFEKIPSGDPQRANLALSLGRRLWFDWTKTHSDGSDEANEQLAGATQYLSEGVTNSNPKTLTYAAAEGALLLAQALLASDNVDGAIARLESDEIAPLKLLAPTHPTLKATGRVNLYHQEAAMTAIKAYMAAMRRSTDDQKKWIDKAGQVITGLQTRLKASGGPDGAKRLTRMYQLISQRLIEQFNSLAPGKPRSDFATSLAKFLGAIEQQSQDARTVVWAGSTLLSVANTLQQDDAKAQAEPIFAKAVSALDRAEELGFGEGQDGAAMAREIKRQRALAQRGAGNFDTALEQLTQLLTAKSGDLNIQLDAAMTLQQQAAATNDAKGFASAILGASPVVDSKSKRKQNAIWGWRKLVLATRGKAKFADAFYQSLYHMIEARYEMGRINQSADGIGKALAELNNWQQRTPDFDNGPWKLKFDQLRQRIQKQ